MVGRSIIIPPSLAQWGLYPDDRGVLCVTTDEYCIRWEYMYDDARRTLS